MIARTFAALLLVATQFALAQQPASTPAPQAQTAPTAPQTERETRLESLRWMQSAAEYRMITTSAFILARQQLDRALRDHSWTAATEQNGAISKRKPAIILDIDETVLDNSTYQAELAAGGTRFTPAGFSAWVDRSAARAIPGSVEFLRYARQRGVAVFFVSNRDAEGEPATVANLRAVGIPTDAAHVLLRKENKWGDEKSTRRAFVAANHRVVLLVGDDLNDFVNVLNRSSSERFTDACAHRAWWGTRWIVIPNAMYGSWDSASRKSPNERISNECTSADDKSSAPKTVQ